jgi:preprotein translocase subunit SecE
MKKKIINFLNEVKAELEKVSWPEKRILKITTGVVVLFMLLFGFYLGVIDLLFSNIIRLFLR